MILMLPWDQVMVSCPGLVLDLRDGVMQDDPLLFSFTTDRQE
jgi:hypothetical protein